MTLFDRAVEFVINAEGNLSDDPEDSGGLTKWGISSAAFPEAMAPSFTREDAIEIYREHFWKPCKCSELPGAIAVILFDAAVNQAPTRAIRELQRSLGVVADGRVGEETIKAARISPTSVITDFAARRMLLYAIHPRFNRFGLGWARRLMRCLQLSLTIMNE